MPTIDNKSLKPGDVVVFGGKIEKTVRAAYVDGYSYPYVAFHDKTANYLSDSIWLIAEVKPKPLPKYLVRIPGCEDDPCGVFEIYDNGNGYFSTYGWRYTPPTLLRYLEEAVAQLKAAGVRVDDVVDAKADEDEA